MNFTAIPQKSFLGKLLRFFLRALPSTLPMPVIQGPLRGKRWIVGSGVHGYWLGSYEKNKCELFERSIQAGDVVFDIGAHVGFYTLLASHLAGPQGKVFAFEPLPRNIRYLKEHLRMNHVENVTLFEAALSDRTGAAYFSASGDSSMGSLSNCGGLAVTTLTLDSLWQNQGLPLPQVVKIDVEGAELAVLHGGQALIQAARPIIFLATHGTEVHAKCLDWLQSADYMCEILDMPDEIVAISKPLEKP
jgi:FkbM family methyltransferase